MSKPRLSVVFSFVSIITVLVGFSVGTAQAPIVPGNSSPALLKKVEQKALGAGTTTTDGRAASAAPIEQQQQLRERPWSKGLDVPPEEYFKGGGPDETSDTLLIAVRADESATELPK